MVNYQYNMLEFDYKLDYKNTVFRPNDTRYRIGRGEQGVLLVRPYTDVICKHWRFKTVKQAKKSAEHIYKMYADYRVIKDLKFYHKRKIGLRVRKHKRLEYIKNLEI